jgi:hypothetical protein
VPNKTIRLAACVTHQDKIIEGLYCPFFFVLSEGSHLKCDLCGIIICLLKCTDTEVSYEEMYPAFRHKAKTGEDDYFILNGEGCK